MAYKEINYHEFFKEKLFECMDVSNHYGALDRFGHKVIPFKYYEIEKFGDLITTTESEYANKRIHNRNKEIFYLSSHTYDISNFRNGYYGITIYSIQLPNFLRANLSFVIDEKGIIYLPREMSKALQKMMRQEN